MMRTPTEYELEQLMHLYDPAKAHDYYEKHKNLKGRKPGIAKAVGQPSGFALANAKRHEAALPRQRRELQARISSLSAKLVLLEALIRKKSSEEASVNRKAKAKKERTAKDKEKPQTAAEKSKAARDSAQYRDKHKQELKNKAKSSDAKSGGSSSKSKDTAAKASSVSELKALASKVRGQIAVAKQKLAAL